MTLGVSYFLHNKIEIKTKESGVSLYQLQTVQGIIAKNPQQKLFTTCLIPTNENDNEQFIIANFMPDEPEVFCLALLPKRGIDNLRLKIGNVSTMSKRETA